MIGYAFACQQFQLGPKRLPSFTFLVKKVMHATGAGAMTQELVIACFIQALLIAPKHRASNIQFPEKRVWTGFPESRSFEWKTSRNLREIGGKLMDKVLATKA